MPTALKDQPTITPEIKFYFDAFFFLSRFRGAGFSGPGPLYLPDVMLYAQLVGYTGADEILHFSEVMAACDEAYRTHLHDSSKKPSGTPAAKGRLPPKRR
jgi:hypothetical protein